MEHACQNSGFFKKRRGHWMRTKFEAVSLNQLAAKYQTRQAEIFTYQKLRYKKKRVDEKICQLLWDTPAGKKVSETIDDNSIGSTHTRYCSSGCWGVGCSPEVTTQGGLYIPDTNAAWDACMCAYSCALPLGIRTRDETQKTRYPPM